MSSPRPLFSIITVVRNSVETIEDCIQSVEAQTFRDFEYIVVDGLSDDGTSEVILKHSGTIDTYIREKDFGIYDAMNKAISLCQGSFIGILNADDTYFKGSLGQVRDVITNFPNSQVVYGSVRVSGVHPRILVVSHHDLERAMIPHPSCFVSADLYRQIGQFDPMLKIAADYDFMLRAFKSGAVFHDSGRTLANYRPGGASARFRLRSIREMISIQANQLGWNSIYKLYRLVRHLGATYLKKSNFRT